MKNDRDNRKIPLYSRRSFLIAAGITGLSAPYLAQRGYDLLRAAPEIFISARTDKTGKHYIGGIDSSGKEHFSISVDLRCHGVAINPALPFRAVVFARRPGDLAYEVDFQHGEVRRKITSPPGRHFFGHGSYSSGGDYLFCTENEFASGTGIVAVYDGQTLKRLGEMPSYGVGPHEARMLSDGTTLVVANGGIQTHPSTGRKKLNLDTMSPSLTYIDTTTGKVVGDYKLGNSKLSIRHLSLDTDDRVAIAMQSQGSPGEFPSLIGFHKGSNEIQTVEMPDFLGPKMNNYTASICMAPGQDITCVSSPRGNIVTLWRNSSRKLVKNFDIPDAGGITYSTSSNSFLVTSGNGSMYAIHASTQEVKRLGFSENMRWDNHLYG